MADDELVEVNVEALLHVAEHAPELLFEELHLGFTKFGRSFVGSFKRERLRASSSGDGVQTRSGSLSRSFSSFVTGQRLDTLAVQIGSDSPYARKQEEGGEIRPVRAQFLTIPLEAAKTPAGVARGPARSFPNTFITTCSLSGALMIWQEGEPDVPLFLLVRRVVLKGRLGFVRHWKSWIPKLSKAINLAVKKAFRRSQEGDEGALA